jgi:hypothetical protein
MPVVYTRSHQQAAGMKYAGIEGGCGQGSGKHS